jgi:hypothetical protein
MTQFVIAFTGVIALLFIQSKLISLREWAGFIGLAGQPFWIYTAYQNKQWGILILSIVYGGVWIKSILTYWSFRGKQIRRI